MPPFIAHPCTACHPRTPWRLRIDVQVEGKMCGHRRIRQGWISSLRRLHPSIHLDTSSEHDRRHARGEDGARIVAGDAAVGAADLAGMVGELVQRGRIGWNAESYDRQRLRWRGKPAPPPKRRCRLSSHIHVRLAIPVHRGGCVSMYRWRAKCVVIDVYGRGGYQVFGASIPRYTLIHPQNTTDVTHEARMARASSRVMRR